MSFGIEHGRPASCIALLVLAALAVSAVSCSEGSGEVQDDGAAQAGDVEADTGAESPVDVPRLGPDLPVEEDAAAGGDDAPGTADAGFGGPAFGRPCKGHDECEGGFCVEGPEGRVCTDVCVDYCPAGWSCSAVSVGGGSDLTSLCVPEAAPCDLVEDVDCCDATTEGKKRECSRENEHGVCRGVEVCEGDAGWGACSAALPVAEVCDRLDNDCDGESDEGLGELCLCGDGSCQAAAGEDVRACPADCAACGDEICSPGEDPLACPVDCCGGCGDGRCLGYACGEDPAACPEDCGTACGNEVCDKGESPQSCEVDCQRRSCGNNVCEPTDGGPEGCPGDCGDACGNCICEGTEDFLACPGDCGYCGDGVCSLCGHLGELERCTSDCKPDEERCNGKDDDGDGETDEGTCADGDPCTEDLCDPESGACSHAPAPDGTECSDGVACTFGDVCIGGACAGNDIDGCCATDGDCPDDGDLCNGLPSCDTSDLNPALWRCVVDPATVVTCDTSSDTDCVRSTCEASTGECEPRPKEEGRTCADGDPCTDGDSCDGEGACAGAPVDCDDGEFCNGQEVCEPGRGCRSGEEPQLDDGIECTLDRCDEEAREIVHEPDPSLCEDGNPCTADSCEATGCVNDPALRDGDLCDAGAGEGSGTCTAGTCLLDEQAPDAPLLTRTVPPSPSPDAGPLLEGVAEDGSTVKVFIGDACAGVAQATVVAEGGAFSVAVEAARNDTSTFHATATDAAGNESGCSAALSYTHDDVAPLVTLVGSEPPSPAVSTKPTVYGTSEPGAAVSLFASAGCDGEEVAAGVADEGGSFSIEVAVEVGSTTVVYGKARDAAGNESACTAEGVEYVHEAGCGDGVCWAPEETETSCPEDCGPVGFVYVPPGDFTMGSPEDEAGRSASEGPQRAVRISRGFWMKATEVTQAEWQAAMGTKPWFFKSCGEDCPVERVTWWEALAFCNALSAEEGLIACYADPAGGTPYDAADAAEMKEPDWYMGTACDGYRLPTEAEWELAARAGSETAIYTGQLEILGANNGPELDPIAWYGGNSGVDYEGAHDCRGRAEKQYPSDWCGTHPAGTKLPNALGLHDLSGNVWEWVWDRYDAGYYQERVSALSGGVDVDPLGPESGSERARRGGAWSSEAGGCRSASRGLDRPEYRGYYLGFRPVRTVSTEP